MNHEPVRSVGLQKYIRAQVVKAGSHLTFAFHVHSEELSFRLRLSVWQFRNCLSLNYYSEH